jgi:hypothetical protein
LCVSSEAVTSGALPKMLAFTGKEARPYAVARAVSSMAISIAASAS